MKERFTDFNGYVRIWTPDHPNAMHNGYVYEHRLVMERSLNRFLNHAEYVHHKNENKSDNRIKNLEIVTLGMHNTLHGRGVRWSKSADACSECGKSDSPPKTKTRCNRCYAREMMRRKSVRDGRTQRKDIQTSWAWVRSTQQLLSACVDCGRSDRPHTGFGRCNPCYQRMKYHQTS